MRVIRNLEIDGRQIQIKELTVGEIRRWLATITEQQEIDIVGSLLFDDLALDDLALLTDMEKEEMETLHQSDLQKISAALRQTNPLFFHLRDRLMKATIAHKTATQADNLNVSNPPPVN